MTAHNQKGLESHLSPLLLAMHSCTEKLGVAILDSRNPEKSLISSTFNSGRKLSNNILHCVEELLPAKSWPKLGRLAVAIGPGGFTGTRLSIVFARTLAQQLNCPLDGFSSFALMAPRLASQLSENEKYKPFWITQTLNRQRVVAGQYQLKANTQAEKFEDVLELISPNLLDPNLKAGPKINATEDVEKDVVRLLRLSLLARNMNIKSEWVKILPIYPTSPVGNY